MNDYIQVATTGNGRRMPKRSRKRPMRAGFGRPIVLIHGPVISTYRWQGKIEKAEEWICLI